MFRQLLLLLLLQSFLFAQCTMGYLMSNCKQVFPDEDNPPEDGMCSYKGYVVSNRATLITPLPDCNECRCRDGVFDCCQYGVKAGPIAVPLQCEALRIDNSCDYKLVRKSDHSKACF